MIRHRVREAAAAVRQSDNVVLSPAFDGGYTLIRLSRPHRGLFEDIPWGTNEVYRLTLQRARDIGLPAVNVSGWYDVDDAEDEFAGMRPAFAAPHLAGARAPATRQFIHERHSSLTSAGVAR